jgi:hypothetical protein
MPGSRSGCGSGTSAGSGGSGRPATNIRTPVGGAAGSIPAFAIAQRGDAERMAILQAWTSARVLKTNPWPGTTSRARPSSAIWHDRLAVVPNLATRNLFYLLDPGRAAAAGHRRRIPSRRGNYADTVAVIRRSI